MKPKNGFFGIFKKKTQAPPIPGEGRINGINENDTECNNNISISNSEENVMTPQTPRKSSIAKTSVLHYSPPGTEKFVQRISVEKNKLNDNDDIKKQLTDAYFPVAQTKIERRSNIVLNDENSVLSTPISQYNDDETQETNENFIQISTKKKRAAPPPPPPHIRKSVAPTPPPHRKAINLVPSVPTNGVNGEVPTNGENKKQQVNYEEEYRKLKRKFDEWTAIRLEDGGSAREETVKAEVRRMHDKLSVRLGKDTASEAPPTAAKQRKPLPAKIGNIYAENRAQKITIIRIPQNSQNESFTREKTSPSSPSLLIKSPNISPRIVDENRNFFNGGNSAAVDRLKKEMIEQRSREKEIKQYRDPKKNENITLKVSTSPLPVTPLSPNGLRLIEYRPMRGSKEGSMPPPIPKTPPPKLSDYRRLKSMAPTFSETPMTVSPQPKKQTIYQIVNGNEGSKTGVVSKLDNRGKEKSCLTIEERKNHVIIASPSKISKKEHSITSLSTPMNNLKQTSSPNYYAPSKTVEIPTVNRLNKIYAANLTNEERKTQPINLKTKEHTASPPDAPINTPALKSRPNPKPTPTLTTTTTTEFSITDILKAPKLRKVGMPVDRNGITLGRVVETPCANGVSSPTPPPPPPPPTLSIISKSPTTPQGSDLRDCLMNEIIQAGLLRAARQSSAERNN